MIRVRRWWAACPLPLRVAAVVTVAALLLFGLLARTGAVVVQHVVAGAVDAELTEAVAAAAPAVAAGRPAPRPAGGDVAVRVLDRAGAPADGGPAAGLGGAGLQRVLAGEATWTMDGGDPTRWSGRVVTAPDGAQRLVVAAAPLVGHGSLVARGALLVTLSGVLAGLVVGLAAWVAGLAALRPVARMRVAAAGLAEGTRLPLPAARDEVRALTEAFNDLLDRRDRTAERLRRFTGDAAHELRSPVAVIRVQAEVAVAHPDPELAVETLSDVADEAQRLSALLDDLLALARADAGHRLPPEPVDLAEVAAGCARRLRAASPAITVRLTAPSPAVVHAAPSDVARVVDNLLTNAARHARCTVRVAVLDGSADVRLLVDDDGDGVPAGERGAVFDRFHRLEPDRDRGTGGTGLGLALVAETLHRYGGTARVVDAPGGGARFAIRWPVGWSSRPANAPPGGP